MTLMHEIADRVRQQETAGRLGEFNHLCLTLMRSKGYLDNARAVAESGPHRAPKAVADVLRAAVSVSNLDEAQGFAGLSAAFVDSLRQASAFDAMLPGMIRVAFKIPVLSATATAVGSEVEEGAPIPVSRVSLGGDTVEPRKAAAIVAVTNRQLEEAVAGTMSFVGRQLRAAVARAQDTVFLAGITDGLTPITSTDPVADLAALLEAVPTGTDSQLHLVVASDVAKGLATATAGGTFLFPAMSPQGGTVLGMPAIVSDGLAAGTMVLADASGIVAAADRTVQIELARHAAIQMDDDPTAGHSELTSLWQTDSSALRAVRTFGWHKARADAAAVVSGISY